MSPEAGRGRSASAYCPRRRSSSSSADRRAPRLLGPLSHVIRVRLASLRSSQKVVFFEAKTNREDLEVMREFLEGGKVTAAIDRRYELSDIADAFRYLGEGHAQGKVVITV